MSKPSTSVLQARNTVEACRSRAEWGEAEVNGFKWTKQHEGARLYHRGASARHLVCFAATVLLNESDPPAGRARAEGEGKIAVVDTGSDQ